MTSVWKRRLGVAVLAAASVSVGRHAGSAAPAIPSPRCQLRRLAGSADAALYP